MGGSWSGSSPPAMPNVEDFTFNKENFNNNNSDVVIIPVDQSRQSEAAFEWYIRHVHRPENVVRVVHCQEIQLNTPFLPELKASLIEEQIADARNTGRKLIDKYEDKLSIHQVRGSVHSEFSPNPGEYICNALDRYDGTMVVMGTRGFGPIKRTIIGSVSQYVLNHSHVPVTVIPPEILKKLMKKH